MHVYMQTYLGEIVGLVPEHHNKASIAVWQVVIILLVEDLALDL